MANYLLRKSESYVLTQTILHPKMVEREDMVKCVDFEQLRAGLANIRVSGRRVTRG